MEIRSNDLIIRPKLPDDVFERLHNSLVYSVNNCQYTDLYKRGLWDGLIRLFNKRQVAPIGCYQTVVSRIKRAGLKISIEFQNDIELNGDGRVYGLELNRLQEAAVDRALQAKICVIHAVVRAGKTLMMAKIIARVGEYPTMVVTKADKGLVNQTRESLSTLLRKPIGILSEGRFESQRIIVAHYQSLASVFEKRKRSAATEERYERVRSFVKSCKILLLDECHHALTLRFRKVIKKFTSTAFRIGLSGTPKPDGVKNLELMSIIGPIVYKMDYQDLIDVGRLAQPIVILYRLPYNWFTPYLTDPNDVYDADIVKNVFRNRFICQLVQHLRSQDKSVCIMVSKLEHGETLRLMIPNSFFVCGKIDSETRKRVYSSVQRNEVCLITIPGKEGIDLPKLDVVINAEGFGASTITHQKMRSLTASEGKDTGLVIDFMDRGMLLESHSKQREKIYESCSGFIIKHKTVPSEHFKEAQYVIN